MNTKEIEILLEKYFEASTTVEEERILREFFQGENLPEHLKSIRPLFRAIEIQSGIKSPVDQENLLMERINPAKRRFFYPNRRLYWISSIAATILLLFSIIYLNNRQDSTLSSNYSPEDIQLAMLQTTEALNYISLKFNIGTAELSQLQKIDYARQTLENISRIDEGMGQLDKLSKLNLITNQ